MTDDRTVWTTRKLRFGDLREGDVTRNQYGKWDTVVSVNPGVLYSVVKFRASSMEITNVHLVNVQTPKPS